MTNTTVPLLVAIESAKYILAQQDPDSRITSSYDLSETNGVWTASVTCHGVAYGTDWAAHHTASSDHPMIAAIKVLCQMIPDTLQKLKSTPEWGLLERMTLFGLALSPKEFLTLTEEGVGEAQRQLSLDITAWEFVRDTPPEGDEFVDGTSFVNWLDAEFNENSN